MAPEVFLNEEYDTKVDVFSFALILQEVKHPKAFHADIDLIQIRLTKLCCWSLQEDPSCRDLCRKS